MESKTINKDWTTSEIDLLINLVREKEDLYDQSRPGYCNINVIDKCWQYIAEHFPTKDAKLCKSKWQILRSSYRTNRHKNYASASGSAVKKIKKWAYFDSMVFLEKHLSERQSSTDIRDNSSLEAPNMENYMLSPEIELLELDPEESNSQNCIVEKRQTDSRPESRCSDTPFLKRKRASASTVEQSFIRYLEKKKPKSSIRSFLESLEEDMEKLSPKGLRNFKQEMLSLLSKHLEDEGK